MAPSRIGPFAIEDRLRRDGRGNTYRGVHIEKRRVLALKIFSAPLAGMSEDTRQAFYGETSRLKALDHANIARCYGGGFDENFGYIAHELLPGESLSELIERRGRLSWEMVLQYGKQLATALEYLHQQRIYHLDLRPDKIIVDNLDQVQLLDCRIDRHQNPFTPATSDEELLIHLAPEQLSGGAETHKTDLYQLGCLLFHMLTGAPPFQATSREERLTLQQQGAPRVSETVFDCPVWLDTLLGQLLAFDPDDRPFGASAVLLGFREATKRMASGSSVAEHAAGGFSPLAKPSDQDEAKRLLGREEPTEKPEREPSGPPLYERTWFLAACLIVIASIGTWLMWPASYATMMVRADKLMASESELDWLRAREFYLEELVTQEEFAERARAHLDKIDAYSANRRRINNRKFNKPPSSEGERLMNQALDLADFGDYDAARKILKGMAPILASEPDERGFLLLAEQKLAEFSDQKTSKGGQTQWVQAKLDEAAALLQQGKGDSATAIWRSIVQLYEGDDELQPLVDQAKSKLIANEDS